jgi:hypothetical protein
MSFLKRIAPSDLPDFEQFGAPPCSETDPDSFFAVDQLDGSMHPNRVSYPMEREAKLMCAACPYQIACLTYALKHPEEQGIWGGTTERDRMAFKRGLPLRLRIPPTKHK